MLRQRDRELICLAAIARYLSTAQVAKLLWPASNPSAAHRRLYGLSGMPYQKRRPDTEPFRPVFDPPYLRRLRYRDSGGSTVDLWGVTPAGHTLAVRELGTDRKLPRDDVAEAFLEHSTVLTDLFVTLAAPFLAAGLRSRELPFRWDPIDTRHLPWEQYDAHADKVRARRMIPDAVLELPSTRRRYFIECEMGTHSIAAASDEKTGATLAKTERYDHYFARDFYSQAFPDRWEAEVLYLVRTDSRMKSVNAALEQWRRGRAGLAVRARGVTLAEAEALLRPLLPAVPPPRAARRLARAFTLTRSEAESLKRFYQESLRHLDALHRELKRSPQRDYMELAATVRPVVTRFATSLRSSTPGGES